MVHNDFKKYFQWYNIGFVLSLLTFLAQLVCRFPFILTTETIRFVYDSELLKIVYYIILVFSSLSFLYSIKIGVKKTIWVIHGVSISLSLFLNSLPISYTALFNGELTIGLDWLILDFLVTAIIFTPLELFSPKNPNQTKFHYDWKTDLTYFIVFDLSVKFIIMAIRFPAEYFFTNTSLNQLHHTIQAIPYFPQLIMALFIADLFQYFRHSTAHRIPFLWKFHSIHHSPEQIDWLSGSRSHLLDLIFDRSVIFMPIYFLGFSSQVFISYTTIVSLQSVWAHSNSHINLGWLKYVIVTPQYHHWHHAKDKEAHDKNFAVHFPVIDMLFGTYHSLENGFPKQTGIEETDFPKHGYIKQFLYPFKRK